LIMDAVYVASFPVSRPVLQGKVIFDVLWCKQFYSLGN
jgi:hypothetical protein